MWRWRLTSYAQASPGHLCAITSWGLEEGYGRISRTSVLPLLIVIQYTQRFNKRTKSARNSQMKTEVKVGVLTVCRRRVTVRPTNRPHRSSPREMCRLFPETRSPVDDHRYSRHTGDSALTSSWTIRFVRRGWDVTGNCVNTVTFWSFCRETHELVLCLTKV
jgi:hypothetical protein